MHALVEAGADLVELGVPFSDPMADGPVIQHANERALARGVGLAKILGWVREFRARDAETPVVLMGYLNPIEIHGVQRFAIEARDAESVRMQRNADDDRIVGRDRDGRRIVRLAGDEIDVRDAGVAELEVARAVGLEAHELGLEAGNSGAVVGHAATENDDAPVVLQSEAAGPVAFAGRKRGAVAASEARIDRTVGVEAIDGPRDDGRIVARIARPADENPAVAVHDRARHRKRLAGIPEKDDAASPEAHIEIAFGGARSRARHQQGARGAMPRDSTDHA